MNPFDMIKNLKNLQSNMQEMQEKMSGIQVTGTSGGDMVKVTLNGQMEMAGIEIATEVVDPGDVAMLQDLIRAAHADAMIKMKEKLQEEMIPPGGMPDGFPTL